MTHRDTPRDTIGDALAAVAERYAVDRGFRERVERQRETAQARLRETLRQLNGLDAILDTANQGLDRSAHAPGWADGAHDDIAELGLDGRLHVRTMSREQIEAEYPGAGPRDRVLPRVAGNVRHLVGRTIIEVKATHRAGLEDYVGDVELLFDDGTTAIISPWAETAPFPEAHGIDIQIGRWSGVCPDCHGKGLTNQDDKPGVVLPAEDCSTCGGSGSG